MMKAIRVAKFGSASVLQLQNVEIPTIAASEVLVKVKAAGVNPVDTYIRSGVYAKLPELPYTPGKDGAGIVHKIGSNVTGFKEGERVFTCIRNAVKYGTYAEYAVVQEEDLFHLDDKLCFEEGAAVGVAYLTAYRALVLKGKCHAGQTVLVHGASGGVGLATVQIAKNKGLTVIGTAGTVEGMDQVKNCGADFVLCHKDQDYLQKIKEMTKNVGVNIIVEMLANVNFDKDLDVLAPNGRLLIVGNRGTVDINPRKLMMNELEVVGVMLNCSSQSDWEEMSREIIQGIRDGWVKPVVHKCYPLEEASKAHEDVIDSAGAKGKLVLSL